MSPWPGRSTLITSAPNQASSWVQVGPDCTCVKSRILMPSRALPSLPQGFLEGGLDETLGALATSLSEGFFAGLAFTFVLRPAPTLTLPRRGRAGEGDFFTIFFFAIVVPYFFFCSWLCGLRLPMRPLSLPAAGSITALMRVG